MTELAIWRVKHGPIANLRPISLMGQENKFRLWIDKISDQPWTCHTIDFNFLASDPFHACDAIYRKCVVRAIESIAATYSRNELLAPGPLGLRLRKVVDREGLAVTIAVWLPGFGTRSLRL